LILKANVESSCSYYSFKRLAPGALTGAKAEAWFLLVHAHASLSRSRRFQHGIHRFNLHRPTDETHERIAVLANWHADEFGTAGADQALAPRALMQSAVMCHVITVRFRTGPHIEVALEGRTSTSQVAVVAHERVEQRQLALAARSLITNTLPTFKRRRTQSTPCVCSVYYYCAYEHHCEGALIPI